MKRFFILIGQMFFSTLCGGQNSVMISESGSQAKDPAVDSFSDGRVAVVWEQSDGLWVRTLSHDGGAMNSPARFRQSSIAESPEIVVGTDGKIRATWRERSSIFFSILGEDGHSEFQNSVSGQAALVPRMALSPDNGVRIVVERREFINTVLSMITFNSDGSSRSVQNLVSRITNENPIEPDIVTDSSGMSVVACHLSVQTSFYDFFLILVGSDGQDEPQRLFSADIRDSNPIVSAYRNSPDAIFLYQISRTSDNARRLTAHSPGPNEVVVGPNENVRHVRASTGSDNVACVVWSTTSDKIFLVRQMPSSDDWQLTEPMLVSPSSSFTPDVSATPQGFFVIWEQDDKIVGKFFPHSGNTPPPFIRSDTNVDGIVDISDAVLTLFWLFHDFDIPCQKSADSNQSGDIDLSDVIYTLNYLFLSGPIPTFPFPNCGQESAEELSCDSFSFCQ